MFATSFEQGTMMHPRMIVPCSVSVAPGGSINEAVHSCWKRTDCKDRGNRTGAGPPGA